MAASIATHLVQDETSTEMGIYVVFFFTGLVFDIVHKNICRIRRRPALWLQKIGLCPGWGCDDDSEVTGDLKAGEEAGINRT